MVVYLKGIYPPEAFERRSYLNIAVQCSRHPQLREYIHSAVTSLQHYIDKDMVERVGVVFCEKNGAPLEKFIFKLKLNQLFKTDFSLDEIEYALRAFLVKLPFTEPIRNQVPEDCSWEILGYFRQLPGDVTDKSQFWIPTDTKLWEQPPFITPIKSLSSEPLDVQLYVENSADHHQT
eukprot:TRINITY_DN2734_c0_g1_i2.p1 TRINITY_DN2734_c0_g1~~TRINITY_DN2734_c0_g1_i2.p1  ORF type:complete len:177 (-),score=25.83 TRINITY_DN2734_c0_g1_i2:244-774(-)